MSTPHDPHGHDSQAGDPPAPPTAPHPAGPQPAPRAAEPGPPQYAPAPSTSYAGSGPGGPDRPPSNGLGIAALVLGIVALLIALIPVIGILGGLLGIVGVILGTLGLAKVRRHQATNRGVALTGIILSVLAILVAVVWGLLIGVVFNQAEDCLDPSLTPEQQQSCLEDQLSN